MRHSNTVTAVLMALVLTAPIGTAVLTDNGVIDPQDDTERHLAYDHLTSVPAGYRGIYTSEELAKIGKDAEYPMNGKYILMDDVNINDVDPTNAARFGDIGEIELRYRLNAGALQVRLINAASAGIGMSPAYCLVDDVFTGSVPLSSTTWTNVPGYYTNDDHKLTFAGQTGGKDVVVSYFIEKDTIATSVTAVKVQTGEASFEPIGNIEGPFTGTFDGNGHMIAGNIWSYSKQTGIFGQISDATVKNVKADVKVTVINPSISPPYSVDESSTVFGTGTLIGFALRSSVIDCESRGEIYFIQDNYISFVGGAVGSADSSLLMNVTSNVSISGTIFNSSAAASNIGGVVGGLYAINANMPARVIGCAYGGDINIPSASGPINAGGIAGVSSEPSYSHIRDSVNLGNISVASASGTSAGGICGSMHFGNVSGCANLGSISVASTGTVNAGGLFGSMFGYVTDSRNKGSVSVKCDGSSAIYAGGLAGMTLSASFYKCCNEGDLYYEGNAGTLMMGGIAGYVSGVYADDVVKDCYNTGNIYADNSRSDANVLIGGLVGRIPGSQISAGYNTGNITLTGTEPAMRCIDGIAGALYRNPDLAPITFVNSCFSTKVTSKGFKASGPWYHENTYDTERTMSEMTDISTFAEWNFKNVWEMEDGTLPVFRETMPTEVTFDPVNGDPAETQTLYGGVPIITAPERNGYSFGGWFTDIDGKGAEYKGEPLTKDTILYAHWTPNSIYIPPEDPEDTEYEKKGRHIFMLLILMISVSAVILIYMVRRE